MKTLIIIDVQRDFMPGGALPVPEGDQVVPIINQLMAEFDHVFATQDWHPKNHVSFKQWPPHCIQNTPGADFAPGLNREKIEAVFRKGSDPDKEAYSGFQGTDLAEHLRKKHAKELYFVGVATDYCVLNSVLDALKFGFKAIVLRDACRAIEDEEGALKKMRDKGAQIV